MVRKAVLSDVEAIHSIIEAFSMKGVMLKRPVSEILDMIRDFFVYEDNGVIVGICALHICSDDMGEIRSLAVREKFTRKGIGRQLVAACLEEAATLGLKKVFALTYRTEFFKKLGFRLINKDVLPHKIWGDCIRCIKFPNCDENAVITEVK
ncbi:MAG: N-acetyltransferase [Deltaproteobacteria bacterium]|nr:N-acetyltransferase [Deltaproteobacteria bacterium]